MIEESKLKPSFIMSHSVIAARSLVHVESEKLLANYLGANFTVDPNLDT